MRNPIIFSAFALACAAPPTEDARNQLELFSPGTDPVATRDHFVEVIAGAESTLQVALPKMEDPAIAEAILAAFDQGVDVQVVTDATEDATVGVSALRNAGVNLRLADNGITYQDFSLNAPVTFSNEQVVMSHAYAIADATTLVTATTAGGLTAGESLTFRIESEDIGQDFMKEHVQLMGGTDASSLTAYSVLAKSITDTRWIYPTQTSLLAQLYFGPQERLLKRIIDSVYGARSSIWILTDEFMDVGLARALQAKAASGFDVIVLVGPTFGTNSGYLSRELRDNTPDVVKLQVQEEGPIPTIVLVDYDEDRMGYQPRSQGFVLTHDLVSATRLAAAEPVATDQLIDGHMWVIEETRSVGEDPAPELEVLLETMNRHYDRAEAL
jgi:hypothetical protein